MKKITEADLLAAVVAATAPPPDDPGVSIAEYAHTTGLSMSQASCRLDAAVGTGKLVVGWATRADPSGRARRRVRVYRPAA